MLLKGLHLWNDCDDPNIKVGIFNNMYLNITFSNMYLNVTVQVLLQH